MHPTLEKLQLKDHSPALVLNAPGSFDAELEALGAHGELRTRPNAKGPFAFVLVFCVERAQIAPAAERVCSRLENDALLWFAYPKKSSKRYRSDISRDDSWQALGDLGFEGVRQIAIDADWSALRFRRAEDIRTLKRDSARAMSAAGKARTKKR